MENVAAPACRQAGFTNRQKCSSRACSAKEVSRRLTKHCSQLTADGSQQEVRDDVIF